MFWFLIVEVQASNSRFEYLVNQNTYVYVLVKVLNPQTERVEIKGQADRLNSDKQDASLKFSIGGVKHTFW